jgi:UDP-2,3-diacylglucosamine pyrophosphatase LpxH
LGILDIITKKNYEKRIFEGLTKAYDNTQEQRLNLDEQPLVFVSDLHKGTRDGADDFRICENAYRTCLDHYYKEGFRLLVVGDVEELWEDWPGKVIEKYKATLELEAKFHDDNRRYERLWGNHDDLWNDPKQVAKHLHQFYPGLTVHEAMKFRVRSGDRDLGILFVVHGHQGTADSDSKSKIPRLFVRYVWRNIQRITKRSLNTPAKDYDLRLRHNRAMFEWAKRHRDPVVMVAGHTHKPVFWKRPAQAADFELTRPELAVSEAEQQRPGAPADPFTVPCYFNTGCCAFSDGDVTAIEIRDGKVRLVRWLDDEGRPQAQVLTAEEDIGDVFDRVKAKGMPHAADDHDGERPAVENKAPIER